MIQGINIYTKSSDLLGRQLTNPSYAKNNKSEFDINPSLGNWEHPSTFILPDIKLFSWVRNKYGENVTAQNAWGLSVEAWYFTNTVNRPFLLAKKMEIMQILIVCKLETYPSLVNEIDKRGGLEFLQKCNHIVSGNKNWEGEGLKSNFIKVLCKSYCEVKGLNFKEEIQETLF
jgi:hypothetical protein